MIDESEELWLMLIIYIISKRNDSVNIIGFRKFELYMIE